jgi:hypothetical protein
MNLGRRVRLTGLNITGRGSDRNVRVAFHLAFDRTPRAGVQQPISLRRSRLRCLCSQQAIFVFDAEQTIIIAKIYPTDASYITTVHWAIIGGATNRRSGGILPKKLSLFVWLLPLSYILD